MPNNIDNLEPKTNLPGVELKPSEIKIIESGVFFIKPGIEVPITDITEMVEFIVALANAISKALTGGWWSLIPSFMGLITLAINAAEGFNRIPGEPKYMTPAQKDKLVAVIKDKLSFSKDVDAIVGVAIDVIFGLRTIISIFKK